MAIGDYGPMFVRVPYVTRVGQTEARVKWIATPGRKGRLLAIAPDGTTIRGRRGALHDLRPNCRYRWIVTIDGVPASAGAFTTAPPDFSSGFALVATGGVGTEFAADTVADGIPTREDARLLLTTGGTSDPPLTDDLLDRRILVPFRRMLEQMPLVGPLGDPKAITARQRAALAEAFEWPGGGERYALTYGPLQIIVLSTRFDADDALFARRALTRPGPRARFVIARTPIAADGPLGRVLTSTDVAAVLTGGSEAYAQRRWQGRRGIPVIVLGAPQPDDRAPGGIRLRMHLHDSRIQFVAVDADGHELDRFTTTFA